MFSDQSEPVPGSELARARRATRIPGRVLAARMGVSHSRVANIEASARPLTPEVVARYLSALSAAIAERDA